MVITLLSHLVTLLFRCSFKTHGVKHPPQLYTGTRINDFGSDFLIWGSIEFFIGCQYPICSKQLCEQPQFGKTKMCYK